MALWALVVAQLLTETFFSSILATPGLGAKKRKMAWLIPKRHKEEKYGFSLAIATANHPIVGNKTVIEVDIWVDHWKPDRFDSPVPGISAV